MILYLTGSQCNDFRSGVTWQYLLSSNIRRVAAFCTRCNLCRWQLGTPYNRLFEDFVSAQMQQKGLRAVHTKDRNIFEPQMEAGSEHFTCQENGLSHIFKIIVSASEQILNNRNLVLRIQVKQENSSLLVAIGVSKTSLASAH